MAPLLAKLRPRGWSLKYRIAFAVAVVFVVMVAITNALQMRLLREDLGRMLAEQQFTLVQRMAREIDAKFETGISVLASTAALITSTDVAQPLHLREEFRARPALLSFFDDILVLGPDGRILVDYPQVDGRAGVDASDRQFFREVVRTHQTVISEPQLGKTRGEPIVQVATPILTLDDRLVGVLVGVIRLYRSSFLGRLNEERLGATGYYVILTRGAKPVYVVHPDRTRILHERPANGAAAVTNAIRGFEGSSEDVSSTGTESIYSSKTLNLVPWVLVAAAPKAEVFAPLVAAQRRAWIATGIAALVLLPVAWLIVWWLLGPLRHLSASMAGLREGEGDFVPVPVKRDDEVGALIERFNLLMRERLDAENAQRRSEEQLRLLADNVPALISHIDARGLVLYANSCYREWFGLDPKAMVGRGIEELFPGPDHEVSHENRRVAMTGVSTTYERDVQTRQGMRTVRTSFFPQMGEAGVVLGVYHMSVDISEERRVQAELDALARRDPLTGLHNRRSFEELLAQAVARCNRSGRRIALLFVDLDHFKAVNDSKGHEAGDEVLQEVAHRIGACVRMSDTVARLGGDEFVVVVEDVASRDDAAAIAGKILEEVRRPISTRAGDCIVGASIGVAVGEGKDTDWRDLLKRADTAHYEAKGAGRDRYHVQ